MIAQTRINRRSHVTNSLVQKSISKPMKAAEVFNTDHTDGDIPLVLIPSYPLLITPFMRIPSGYWVLKQKWNAHSGMMDPGLKMFWPAWNRVSHIVTKQAVTYCNPVCRCPTRDNVMVDIDISITFQVGPNEEDAVNFVYSLGAHRFDELLFSIMQQAIRGLVNAVTHDRVHDLREEFALDMKKDLHSKMQKYGVVIHNVKVTNVDLPEKLASTLEETTAFQTRMEEQEKNHEHAMRMLVNEETQRLTALEKKNERAIQDLEAKKARVAILRNEKRTEAESLAEVQIADHASKNENELKKWTGDKRDTTATASARAVRAKAKPTVELENLKKEFEQYIKVAEIKRDAQIKAAEREAAKILAEAEMEAASAEYLTEKRKFDYQQKKIAVDAELVAKAPLIISGKNGDELIRRTLLNIET